MNMMRKLTDRRKVNNLEREGENLETEVPLDRCKQLKGALHSPMLKQSSVRCSSALTIKRAGVIWKTEVKK